MLNQALRLGIDACNIRRGGGLTHLIQLLQAAEPEAAGIGEVLIWSHSEVLAQLPERKWLRKCPSPALDGSLGRRMAWQRFSLPAILRRERCDVLFAPGGLLPLRVGIPTVTMSQNMLPFKPAEAARFGRFSPFRLKMRMLRHGQTRSMRRADGLIFLSNYARLEIMSVLGEIAQPVRVIPHGLAPRFFMAPRPSIASNEISEARPFRLLYVSTVDMYKHQWEVVDAVAQLQRQGIAVRLDLVGSSVPKALARLKRAIDIVDPDGRFVTYHRAAAFEEMHRHYQQADAFIFASSCENLPNILLEAMAAGMPIACSNMGPMPEVLDGAGVYFDPLDARSIAEAVRKLIDDPLLRERLASQAYRDAQFYSWSLCARDSFAFIGEVANRHGRYSA